MVSLPEVISFTSVDAAELLAALADALAALVEALALLADALVVLADALLPDALAALEEPPEEQPTRANAATITASAAKIRYFLAFMFPLPFNGVLPLRFLRSCIR